LRIGDLAIIDRHGKVDTFKIFPIGQAE